MLTFGDDPFLVACVFGSVALYPLVHPLVHPLVQNLLESPKVRREIAQYEAWRDAVALRDGFALSDYDLDQVIRGPLSTKSIYDAWKALYVASGSAHAGDPEAFRTRTWNIGPKLCAIRKRMLDAGEKDAWLKLWIETLSLNDALDKRGAFYAQHNSGMTEEERREFARAFGADFDSLFDGIDGILFDMNRADYKASMAKLQSGEFGQNALNLDAAMKDRMTAVCSKIAEAVKALPPGTSDDTAYTLNAIRDRYLPDTIAAYREAYVIDPRVAAAMLDRQMHIIEEGVAKHLAAVQEQRLDKLAANEKFLQERFGQVDSVQLGVPRS